MQRKLLAVAVAGALAAPAVAVAQSTVQIFGTVVWEQGWVDQADAPGGVGRPNSDYIDAPGSELGVKGVEQLGGGLSIWFQCLTTMDHRGFDKVGLCSRNSAIGFRGGFGNIFSGRWDTPMKRALNIGTVGAEETGTLGVSYVPFGGSGSSQAADGADNGTDVGEGIQRQRWKRRESCLTTYETPSFGGFQVMGAMSCGNAAADNAVTENDRNQKPRVWSIAGTYVNGPLGIGLTYEKHEDFGFHGGLSDLDDDAWGISAAYTFGGKIKVGGTFLQKNYETITGDSEQKTWTVGVDWEIAGPHSVHFQYGQADDVKGDSTAAAIGGNGGMARPGSDTGGDHISVAYQYAFSKRTTVRFGYVRVDNDNNTNAYRVGSHAAPIANGSNADGIAVKFRHRF